MKMNKWQNLSIQAKLVSAFAITSFVVLISNLFLYSNINAMLSEIDHVYQSNNSIAQLTDTISEVHTNLEKYLNDKSYQTLDAYYTKEQELTILVGELNGEIYDDEILMMERNISNMIEAYLVHTNQAISAKRGRNVELYRAEYEEANDRYELILSYITELNNNRFVVNNANYQVLVEYMQYFQLLSIGILIVVSIGVICAILLLTQNIIGPLQLLAKVANQVAQGNLAVEKIPVYSKDEIGIVSTAFNQMVDRIEEYVYKLRKNLEVENEMKEKELIMQAHLKDAQLKYLQAQINPHFLFNTLNAGAQLAMLEEADKTCAFIENMADFFRYNVKKINEDSSIEEELELVDNYLYILNVRFGGEIHYSKEIEEEWIHQRVPSMILQPLVENAVNYGIRGIDWDAHITVRVYEEEGYICMSVADNGIGISPELAVELLKGEEREADLSKDTTGIGLGNVISRLQVYYSQEKVMLIRSEGANKGTEVILLIPKK